MAQGSEGSRVQGLGGGLSYLVLSLESDLNGIGLGLWLWLGLGSGLG